MPKRNIIWILVAGVVALLLWKIPESAVRRDDLYTKYGPLLDVRVQVLKHYVEGVSDAKLLKGAVDGMLSHLDPYCAYFDQKEYEQFDKRTKGQFYGIGVEVTRLPGEGLLIVSPIEGSPAFQAGLRAGDRITGIDGLKTDNMPLAKGVELISGKPGTSVHLTLYRPSTEETFSRTVTRGLITVRTVRGWARNGEWDWDYLIDPEHRIGYVRISAFEGQTPEQFDEVIRDLLARHHMRGLVLDVRDNPGGLLPKVVSIVDRFVREGRIVSTKRRVGPEQTYIATGKDLYPDFPMAVLINRGSASASEILAGALRDHGRATLVGERTFGKGSVQELIPLENGNGAIKLTTAYYYLPNGERIHGHGVAPHIVVDLTPEEKSAMLESQVAVFSTSLTPSTQPSTQPATATAPDPTARVEMLIDRQLQEALKVVREQLATRPAE
ncbi:MAG TPA: S41 family peptidase [Phycisphaerae bacterium]|nr:S41 family peptidase [Phycisphaerae bacterium]HOJ76131.1 S41 family peptidase [Phycisphaerae bacterium]HOM53116.1 S41 family peptidase [Phycisphaerae bacterium]HON66931.1 S41 family peptidase [Phycisphaerae bacterium]HOQ85514.1 S41 family peptidase [Phycisphaerae bacterium]